MKKRFVAKKKSKKIVIIKMTLLAVVIYVSLVVTFNILMKSKIKEIFNDSLYDNLFELGTNETNIVSLDLLNPKSMFSLSLNYVLEGEVKNPIDGINLMKKHENSLEPQVYIYNTHDTEGYDSSLIETYNIKYTVKIASYILSEYLQDLGVASYVEAASMSDYLSTSGLLYKDSYEASKYYIEKRLKEFPSIKYIIDLHRDSVPRSATTTVIDGKSYAKVLFVVGMDHEGYESNLALAKKLSDKLPEGMSRGVIEKSGSRVNGIYNQNLSSNAILLETGGLENNIEEVDNTLKVIAEMIRDTVNGG